MDPDDLTPGEYDLTPSEWSTLRTIVLHPLQTLDPTASPCTNSRLKLQTERQLSPIEPAYDDFLREAISNFHTETAAPLRPSLYLKLCFYCWHLEPFLFDALRVAGEDYLVRWLQVGVGYRYVSDGVPMRVLRERFKCGLLRKGQVLLIEAATRALNDELKDIMEWVSLKEGNVETERVSDGLKLMHVANMKYVVMMDRFLSSPKFRSERMENTLLRYLAEEEVNMELVEKLDMINYEREGPRNGSWEDYVIEFPYTDELKYGEDYMFP